MGGGIYDQGNRMNLFVFGLGFSASHLVDAYRDRFVRNVLIALGNSGDAAQAGHAENLLADASPLVRGAAVWALSRLLPAADFAALVSAHRLAERDTSVLEEWQAGLAPAAADASPAINR